MLALCLHPSETRQPRHRVRASARRIAESELVTLRFEIAGASFVMCEPASETPRRRDELWKATCLECFIGGPTSSYQEWNFASGGDWAAYEFDGYRKEMRNAEVENPAVQRTSTADLARYEIDLVLNENFSLTLLQLSLTSVVLEKNDPKPFYWALSHAGPKPDFHLRESFTLELGS
jgi:hypothetical protein